MIHVAVETVCEEITVCRYVCTIYHNVLQKWNCHVNLVSSTMGVGHLCKHDGPIATPLHGCLWLMTAHQQVPLTWPVCNHHQYNINVLANIGLWASALSVFLWVVQTMKVLLYALTQLLNYYVISLKQCLYYRY